MAKPKRPQPIVPPAEKTTLRAIKGFTLTCLGVEGLTLQARDEFDLETEKNKDTIRLLLDSGLAEVVNND